MYEITAPRFLDLQNNSLKEVNILIDGEELTQLKRVREQYYTELKDNPYYCDEEGGVLFSLDSTKDGRFSFNCLSNKFISYTSYWELYNTGAAHGNEWTIGYNLWIDPVRDFRLRELFSNFDDALPIFAEKVHEKLMLKAQKEFDITDPAQFYFDEKGLEAIEENFRNFFFTPNAIVFIYHPYQIACYAMGEHLPEITFDELLEIFPQENKLVEFVKMIQSTSIEIDSCRT